MPSRVRQFEEAEQRAFVSACRFIAMPSVELQGSTAADFLLAIPNGAFLAGNETKRVMQMARLKAMGLRQGASDLLFAFPCGQYHGLWVEMKKQRQHFRGRAEAERAYSEDQRTFHQAMQLAGYATAVCYGAREADEALRGYLAGRFEWDRWNPTT